MLYNRLNLSLTLMVLIGLAAIPPQMVSAQIDTDPVEVKNFVILGPENSKVEFIGTHVGDDPKPRLGGFQEFRGSVGVDLKNKTIESLQISFEIGSIWTEFDKLTAHLMNADFFDQAKFPVAQFNSTRVVNLPNGSCNIQGELNLHGQSATISIPATYQFSDAGLQLTAQFFLDRTEFGMDKMTDGVEKQVSINFIVGQPDQKSLEKNGHPNGNESPAMKPVVAQPFVVIGQQNSSVEFVGTHVGDDPKPRLGGFQEFRGMVGIDPELKTLTSMQMQFDIGSTWTEFDNLTKHLLSADFFDLTNHPTASFVTQQIQNTGDGTCNIIGKLNLHGTSSGVSFPATFTINEQGLTLTSQFTIDRTEFGMDKMTDGVEAPVSIRFTIGTPDRKFQEAQQQQQLQEQSRLMQLRLNSQSVKVFLPEMLQY